MQVHYFCIVPLGACSIKKKVKWEQRICAPDAYLSLDIKRARTLPRPCLNSLWHFFYYITLLLFCLSFCASIGKLSVCLLQS